MDLLRRGLLLGAAASLSGCAVGSPGADHAVQLPVPVAAQANRITVFKSARIMRLEADGQVLREYPIGLGFNPVGHKQFQGDGRTPEGHYRIGVRNPQSAFHLSLGVSYPSPDDRAMAFAKGRSPGGDIFIHGSPNGALQEPIGDWTRGCIAVSNSEIEEIWRLVPVGCPILLKA